MVIRPAISKNYVLCLLLLLISHNSLVAEFSPPRIVKSLRHFDTGSLDLEKNERLYIINKGIESNIKEGDVLNVYREYKPVPSMPAFRLYIGTMILMDAYNGTSIGRFEPNWILIEAPGIKYKTPLLGDMVIPRLILDSAILFDQGRADLKPKIEEEFKKVADFIQAFTPAKVIIEGHTDSDGDEESNLALSITRAETVRLYLINSFEGIPPNMLEAKGYGETHPVVNNDTPENKMLNRRIEVLMWE